MNLLDGVGDILLLVGAANLIVLMGLALIFIGKLVFNFVFTGRLTKDCDRPHLPI